MTEPPGSGSARRPRRAIAKSKMPTPTVAPTIIRRGASWFSSFGRDNNKGTKQFQISGHVNKPRVVGEGMSIAFSALIEERCGGIAG